MKKGRQLRIGPHVTINPPYTPIVGTNMKWWKISCCESLKAMQWYVCTATIIKIDQSLQGWNKTSLSSQFSPSWKQFATESGISIKQGGKWKIKNFRTIHSYAMTMMPEDNHQSIHQHTGSGLLPYSSGDTTDKGSFIHARTAGEQNITVICIVRHIHTYRVVVNGISATFANMHKWKLELVSLICFTSGFSYMACVQ